MSMRYLKNISTLRLDPARCTGCGTCKEVCPHGVFALEKKKALITDLDACMECGACSMNCPARAITVQQGVGCAYAILNGMLKGTKAVCGCGCETGTAKDSTCC